jgi:HEAT repeat protein
MSRHAKGVRAAAAIVLVTGAAIFIVRRYESSPSISVSAARVPGGFLTAPGAQPVAAPSEPSAGDQMATVMAAWRAAIIAHDPDTVLACDRIFVSDGRAFTPALVKSAQSDSNERVRAFSTRVLGKLGDVALIELFRTQLADRSPFVRENAAWSLGELETRAGGVARDLERLKERDQAEAVRRAAAGALLRVRGAGARRRAG